MDNERLGEIAYNAYCGNRNWLSVKGEPLPHWTQQSESLRNSWIIAAKAVALSIKNQTDPG